MTPDPAEVSGVVTNGWPFAVAGYALTAGVLVAYGARLVALSRRYAPPAADRGALIAMLVGTAVLFGGVIVATIDYQLGLMIPKTALYVWSTPGVVAVLYGLVRTL